MGGAIASNNSDNAVVIIAGVIGGMIVGSLVENSANIKDGTEYVIKTANEAIFSVAQLNSGKELFPIGCHVILQYGFPCRLIRDPRPLINKLEPAPNGP